MTWLVFFLEELSARAMLEGLLPRIVSEQILIQTELKYVVFDGKQDLKKRLPEYLCSWQIPSAHLPNRLHTWQKPMPKFVVLCDKDGEDCKAVKQQLLKSCRDCGKPDVLVRIVCHELEAWYLGDLKAVEAALGTKRIARLQGKQSFRSPDLLVHPAQELKRLSNNTYQKVSGSRAIGPKLALENNCSSSFNAFVTGLRRLVGNGAA